MNLTSLDPTIAEELGCYLITRGGARLRLRPVATADGPLLAEFFERLLSEDLRFRFLDTRKQPSAAEIDAMIQVDHRRGEHVLVFDTATGDLIATLLILADLQMDVADVTIAVASGWNGRGIGWTLLRHASDLAFIRGIKKLRSVERRANHDALEVERTPGFHASAIDGEPGLVLLEADLA